MKIYISGRISGLPLDEAKDKFATVAQRIAQKGDQPMNPFDNNLPDDAGYEAHMEADIAMLRQSDAVVFMPCWVNSRGALRERIIALEENIPILAYESI